MTTTRKTVSLGEHFDRFIEAQVAHGRFNNDSEVIRAGLRMLEDQEMKMKQLRGAIAEGDADVAAGRVAKVEDPTAFAEDIVKRGQKRSNRKT